MSYDIVYDKVFLKTTSGNITPVTLQGSNNLSETSYDSHGRPHERRCRSWGVMYNLLDKSPVDILCAVGAGDPDDQCFKEYGKWVTREGLCNFLENGIKNAITVEDLLASTSDCRAVSCSVTVYYGGDEPSQLGMQSNCYTTKEFESWIFGAKELAEAIKGHGKAYFTVNFGGDNALRRARKRPEGRVAVKQKGSYVSEYGSTSVSYSRSADDAVIFDSVKNAFEELPAFITRYPLVFVKEATVEEKQNAEYIINANDGSAYHRYVGKKTQKGFNVEHRQDRAKRFLTEKRAAAYISKTLAPAFPKLTFEIEHIA